VRVSPRWPLGVDGKQLLAHQTALETLQVRAAGAKPGSGGPRPTAMQKQPHHPDPSLACCTAAAATYPSY
jgi:hypothetical protein